VIAAVLQPPRLPLFLSPISHVELVLGLFPFALGPWPRSLRLLPWLAFLLPCEQLLPSSLIPPFPLPPFLFLFPFLRFLLSTSGIAPPNLLGVLHLRFSGALPLAFSVVPLQTLSLLTRESVAARFLHVSALFSLQSFP